MESLEVWLAKGFGEWGGALDDGKNVREVRGGWWADQEWLDRWEWFMALPASPSSCASM